MLLNQLSPALKHTVVGLLESFDELSEARKETLRAFEKLLGDASDSETNLLFVCTHNSRRSHVTMIWAQLAAYMYGYSKVRSFSGGTEVTAFNTRAISALQRAGFDVVVPFGTNPTVRVGFGKQFPDVTCFSKRYDDAANPQKDYIAVMTCADADQNCPHLPAARHRFALRYTDPGYADGTAQEAAAYDTLVEEVGRELLYVFGCC